MGLWVYLIVHIIDHNKFSSLSSHQIMGARWDLCQSSVKRTNEVTQPYKIHFLCTSLKGDMFLTYRQFGAQLCQQDPVVKCSEVYLSPILSSFRRNQTPLRTGTFPLEQFPYCINHYELFYFFLSRFLDTTSIPPHHHRYTGKLVRTITARSRRSGNVTHIKNNLSKNIPYVYFN